VRLRYPSHVVHTSCPAIHYVTVVVVDGNPFFRFVFRHHVWLPVQDCPAGFTDTGADCLKPAAYGRGKHTLSTNTAQRALS
jgi:hypothetical protein